MHCKCAPSRCRYFQLFLRRSSRLDESILKRQKNVSFSFDVSLVSLRFNASSMRKNAARSLIEPPGLRYSALTKISQPVSRLNFGRRINGVLKKNPIRRTKRFDSLVSLRHRASKTFENRSQRRTLKRFGEDFRSWTNRFEFSLSLTKRDAASWRT